MSKDEYEVTIGTGGWVLVVFAGLVTFAALRFLMLEPLFPSVAFAVAIALIVLLLLMWLARKVTRAEDEDLASQRVRKIVPAADSARMDGLAGETAAPRAIPVRPEALKAQRVSSVVTPLAEVEPAPLMQPAPKVAAGDAGAAVTATDPVAIPAAPTSDAAAKSTSAKPKAQAKPKVPKAEPKAKPEKAAKPKATKAAKAAGGLERLTAPRKGKADDLKEIEGIGPALEGQLNALGFYHFDQVASWTDAQVAEVDAEMKTFKGRITRDKWVEQARIIVNEGLDAFRERAKSNNY